MKLLHRLPLIVMIALFALPLVIRAQGNGQPPAPSGDDDLIVPIPPNPNQDDSDLIVPIPVKPNDDDSDLVVPIPPNANDDGDLVIPIPPNANDDGDLVIPIPPNANDDGDLVIPIPPKPPKTAVPTTSIVNGLWVLDPKASGYGKSGQCKIPGGDNGGPDGNGQDLNDLPKVPVCMTSDKQWLTVDSGSSYPLVLANYYSQQQMSREVLETNGETSGSISVNTTRQYHVISPTEIEFSYIRSEQGGCSTTSTVRYKLVEVNNLVCKGVVMTPNFTAVPTQMPTAQPGEVQQPPVIPEPPVQIGGYTIQLPPVDDTCKADQMPPSSSLNISYDTNQNMFINFGGGSYTLYWNGSDYYEYRKGNQFMVSMATYPGGASLSWSNNGCFVNSPLMHEGQPTPTSIPVEPTRTAVADAAAIAGSSFSVTADTPDYLCAAENKSMLPDLSAAFLKAGSNGNFTFSVGGQDYSLENANGIPGFQQMNSDGSMLVITMNGFYEGNGMGSFMVVSKDGKSCIAQLTFKPQ